MRASTLVFLILFAGLFGHVRKHVARHVVPAGETDTAVAPVSNGQTRAIEAEITATDRKLRETEVSLRSLDKSVRSLQDLVKRTEKELCRCSSEACQSVLSLRCSSLDRIKAELDQVTLGHRQLQALKESLEGESLALRARLQLARAGVLVNEPDAAATPLGRPSPLEALSRSDAPTPTSLSLRHAVR